MPPYGIICYPQVGTCYDNLYTKFEVSTFTHYKDTKGNA